MSGVDIVILAIIIVSALVSLVRGFFREAVSLLTWIGAIIITLSFTRQFATLLPPETIESPTARLGISAVVLFLGCLFIGGLINYLFQKIMANAKLGPTDRVIGVIFGILRGVVMVALLVLVSHLVPTIPQESWWQQSRLIPRFENIAESIHDKLPQEIADHFDFSNA